MPKYICTPGVIKKTIEAPHAAAAAIEYWRQGPLSHGQVAGLTVTRDEAGAEAIYFDPQECIRMSLVHTGAKEWDYQSMLD